MAIQNLATHTLPFVTVQELASYWHVSSEQVRRLISTGALQALRPGARVYRIPVRAALAFEQRITHGGSQDKS